MHVHCYMSWLSSFLLLFFFCVCGASMIKYRFSDSLIFILPPPPPPSLLSHNIYCSLKFFFHVVEIFYYLCRISSTWETVLSTKSDWLQV